MTRPDLLAPVPPHRSAAWSDEAERARVLPRLMPLTAAELADHSAIGRRRVADRLIEALAAERRRGRAGHWSYSHARHLGLLEALAAERTSTPGDGDAGGDRPTLIARRASRPAGRKKRRRRGS